MSAATVPDWADRWIPRAKCLCGARLVEVDGWGGTHVVCSRSGWSVDRCEGRDASRSDAERIL